MKLNARFSGLGYEFRNRNACGLICRVNIQRTKGSERDKITNLKIIKKMWTMKASERAVSSVG